ncbi:MAG: LytTR family DNA-binding domain-containing protein [Lentimicrobium sp.]|jgi:DNA-binding LytR/AlgR family response regulator|nr:LytTR family DNA-binding domain-containing protein [Lentimicrobium sp.]
MTTSTEDKLVCLVVDDEQPAQWVLKSYIEETERLKLAACAFDAVEALQILKTQSIDLLFLDINLPGLSGLDLLDTLENQPMVIFTTAYSSYAVNSFDYNVVDYLVKPITRQHFDRAIGRACEKAKLQDVNQQHQDHYQSCSIELNLGGSFETVDTNDILYLQSYGNYVKVFMENGRMILATSTTHQLMSLLPLQSFIRIHKSYIVNRRFISAFSSNSVLALKEKLPIGISYRQAVLTAMNPA